MARGEVTSHGVSETEALTTVLGPEGLTHDRYRDARRAFELLTLRRRGDYKLLLRIVLHVLYSELRAATPDEQTGWKAVAEQLGLPPSTVWKMAHPEGRHKAESGRTATEPTWAD